MKGTGQRLGHTITGFVPSDAFRASALPSLEPILAAYPTGNGPLLDDNTSIYMFQGSQIADEDSGMIRLDQRFSDRLAGFVRFNMDESVSNVPLGNLGQNRISMRVPRTERRRHFRWFRPRSQRIQVWPQSTDHAHNQPLASRLHDLGAGFHPHPEQPDEGRARDHIFVDRQCELGTQPSHCEGRRGNPAHPDEPRQLIQRHVHLYYSGEFRRQPLGPGAADRHAAGETPP